MEEANNLFVPFYRLHSKDDFEGSGIGLSIVKRIVERHNGSLWFKAKENVGATFYFTLNLNRDTNE
jgi:signal transduction histidine kinase